MLESSSLETQIFFLKTVASNIPEKNCKTIEVRSKIFTTTCSTELNRGYTEKPFCVIVFYYTSRNLRSLGFRIFRSLVIRRHDNIVVKINAFIRLLPKFKIQPYSSMDFYVWHNFSHFYLAPGDCQGEFQKSSFFFVSDLAVKSKWFAPGDLPVKFSDFSFVFDPYFGFYLQIVTDVL